MSGNNDVIRVGSRVWVRLPYPEVTKPKGTVTDMIEYPYNMWEYDVRLDDGRELRVDESCLELES